MCKALIRCGGEVLSEELRTCSCSPYHHAVLIVPPNQSLRDGRPRPYSRWISPRLMLLISVNEGWWQDGLFVVVWAERQLSPLTRGDKGVGRWRGVKTCLLDAFSSSQKDRRDTCLKLSPAFVSAPKYGRLCIDLLSNNTPFKAFLVFTWK